MTRTVKVLAVPAVAALVLLLGGRTASACVLSSINSSSAYGAPGGNIEITGKDWAPVNLAVVFHWDTLTGPVLATVMPVADPVSGNSLPTTPVTIPAGAQPGLHMIVATNSTYASSNTRIPIQVLSGSGSGAAPPGVMLATGTADVTPGGVGVGTLALLGILAMAGMLATATGAVSLVRTRERAPVPSTLTRR